MIEPNNEKTFACVCFYTADEKLCEYEKFFGEKSKTRGKLIQSGTPGQHNKNRDCPGKTGAVGMFDKPMTEKPWQNMLHDKTIPS